MVSCHTYSKALYVFPTKASLPKTAEYNVNEYGAGHIRSLAADASGNVLLFP